MTVQRSRLEDGAARVLVLTDGVAGHDRASDGIVAALALLRPVTVQWLGIREARPRSRRISRLAAAFAEPERWLARHVELAPERVAPALRDDAVAVFPERADIVVATGPSVAAANVAVARRYGARNIYYGFPKWPHVGYTLLISPVRSLHPSVALAPRPSGIDATALPPARPLDARDDRVIALLIGGDTKHYRYSASDLTELAAAALRIIRANPGWRLDVYDSRRTPQLPFEALVVATEPLRSRVRVHRFADAGAFSNASAFAADFILVTADSLSMISEATASARPTLVVRPERYRGPRRDRTELACLAQTSVIGQTTFGELSESAMMSTPRPPTVSHVKTLAALLADRGFARPF